MGRFGRGALALLTCFASTAQAQLVPIDGRPAIPVRSQRVEALVEDGLARTSVRQVFFNPHETELEAIYLLRIPEGAALVDLVLEVGGERIQGLLAERKDARRTYDEIVRARRDPALVEQIGAGRFRLSVFPVLPRSETAVELAWIEDVPLAGGAYRYVCPLASGDGAPCEQLVTVRVRSALPLASVSASRADAQVVRPGAGEALVVLESRGAPGAEDLVVTAEIASRRARVDLRTYRGEAGDGWFLALVTPPSASEAELVPRDVVLVVDTSGSMHEGGKLEEARRSALWLLRHVRAVDRVQIVRFSSDVESSAPEPIDANPANLARLEAFVQRFEALGGTALGDALQAATAPAPTPGRARTVVFLTDGRPTLGETSVAKLVQLAAAAGRAGARIYTFGVGADVDAGLLRGIAAAGRGRAELIRPGGELESRLTAFLERTAAPVLTDLVLEARGIELFDVYPRPLPDLHLGEQVVICGRYRAGGSAEVRLSGRTASEHVELALDVHFAHESGGARSVLHHFARRKLAYLDDALRLRTGLADDAYFEALDRGAYSTAEELVQEMIAVSLEHGIQCAYTSFLALLPGDRERLASTTASDVGAATAPSRPVVLNDAQISDHNEEEIDPERASAQSGPHFAADSPFDDRAFNDAIGSAGGAGGKFGARFGGKRVSSGARDAVLQAAIDELASQQDPDGSWRDDVGLTGLVLCAFLQSGHTTRTGLHRERVLAAVRWLREAQDLESGCIGAAAAPAGSSEHALALLALVEAYNRSLSPSLRGSVASALACDAFAIDAMDASALGWWMLAREAASTTSLGRAFPGWGTVLERAEQLFASASLRDVSLLALVRSMAPGTPDAERPAPALSARVQECLAGGAELDAETVFWITCAARRIGELDAWRPTLRAWLAQTPVEPGAEPGELAFRALCLVLDAP